MPAAAFDAGVQAEESTVRAFMNAVDPAANRDPLVNPYVIGKELGEEMTAACTVVRSEGRLTQCLAKIDELKDRFSRVRLSDSASWTNQSMGYARAVGDMLLLAEAIAQGAKQRRESRGAHYRTDYPERDDANYMKSTIAACNGASCSVRFEPIDASLVAPTARTYGKKDDKPAASKAPEMAAAR
jgi:succinate dehydrogenase / fumarate reductase flavoprotein subunit